jgi:pimeloyl-ACP methyl ester carboxylesterase
MSNRALLILSIVVVALAGAVFGFVQIDRTNVGIPRFYVWRMVSGAFHGGNRANVNGISLYYETYGAGPPVIVLHGATGFLETMHYFITALAPTHTVIAVDSRAQGRSTDSAAPLSYGLMADDVLKLMDSLHLKQADVVGWSDGGIIGLDLAMNHPDRVRRLVAIGANYDTRGVMGGGADFTADVARQVKPFYDRIAPDPSHFRVMLAKIKTLVTTEPHYTTDELARIRAKTLIVAGEHDIILRAHTDTLAAVIPGAQKVIVPGASHFGPLEEPDVYDDLVVKFLNAP